MKNKLLLSCAMLLIMTGVSAQWSTSNGYVYLSNSFANVSIGATSGNPASKLFVAGNSQFNGTTLSSGLFSAYGGIRGSSATSGAVRITSPTGYLDVGSMNSDWAHFETDRPNFYFNKSVYINGALSSYGANNLYLQTNGASRVTILQSNGNVGIGTSTPSKALEVNGDISLPSITGNKQIYTWDGNNTDWRIGMSPSPGFERSLTTSHTQYVTYSYSPGQGFAVGVNAGQSSFEVEGQSHRAFFRGNVGIGSAAPTEKLHLSGGAADTYIKLEKLDDSKESGLVFTKGSSTLFHLYNDDTSNALKIQASGITGEGGATPRMQFPVSTKDIYMAESGGNVGIGTSAPAYRLDIAGEINATGLNVNGQPFVGTQWTTSGSTIYYSAGKVGIGTPLSDNPNNYTLAVNGKIGTKDVQIEAASTTWPDYVFDPAYELPALSEVERYVLDNKHLEGIPSAGEVRDEGYSMGEFNIVLLKKVEELTLYIIEQQKQIDELKKKLESR